MAAIHDLLAQVQDQALRERIEKEIDKLSKTKKFGLVFEEHLPECTPLYDVEIKRGSSVAKKTDSINEVYDVLNIQGNIATCINKTTQAVEEIPIDGLIAVAQFGEPIYPYLKPIDSVENAPDSELWHTLIEADNYHALQLLEYLYAGKVDCIYIDPPYNTGAKDWKYNNDYVDGTDAYRHSKWLSFIKKRLELAKKLLNPMDSVLIVTIDDKEYLHLGCLLEEMFPEARIQMISAVINPKGTMLRKVLPRTDEYIYFVLIGDAEPKPLKLSNDWLIGNADNTKRNRYRWVTFVRTAANVSRSKTPTMFYPIFVNEEGNKILRVGDSLPPDVDYRTIKPKPGERVVFPINSKGKEAIWHLTQESLMQAYEGGFVKLGGFTKSGFSISYLPSGMQKKILDGELPIIGHNEDGSVIFDTDDYEPEFVPGTQWRIRSHDATEYGTKLLERLMPDRVFPFPKSLYAVEDAIRFFISEKPNALVLDFFAGSGTTANAVMLLNHLDNGHRQSISVTNNEVGEREKEKLKKKGLNPSDEEWNKWGIAEYLTWPRIKSAITGINTIGKPIDGEYKFTEEFSMSEGFATNAAFFKLSFLDKTAVALGKQLYELLPVLWLKAGAYGPCPSLNDKENMLILPENRMAILINERYFMEFEKTLYDYPEIETVFFITDSEVGYREMIKGFANKHTYQLYRDYLDNFRINAGR